MTPTWVYSAGAASFTFIDKASPTPKVIPVPWDPVFLREWTEFIADRGARYGGNDALSHGKVPGVNSTTCETMLPSSQGETVTSGSANWTTTNDFAFFF